MHDAVAVQDTFTFAKEVAFALAKGVGVAVEVAFVALPYVSYAFSVTVTDEVTFAFGQPLGEG